MTNHDKCLNCEERYEACHDKCDNYPPTNYDERPRDEYEEYMIERKYRRRR